MVPSLLCLMGVAFAQDPAAQPFGVRVDPLVLLERGGDRQLELVLTLKPETKLYVDRIAVVPQGDTGGITVGEAVLPAGKDFMDPWTEENRPIYDADTAIQVPLHAGDDVKGRIELTLDVQWQGCTDRMCYPPGGEVVTVPVRIVKRSR